MAFELRHRLAGMPARFGIRRAGGVEERRREFETVGEGLELLERYYPGRPIEAKVQFFLEELLSSRG